MSDTTASVDATEQESAKQRKKRYKKSLNLPKTAFPMRANLAQNEPQTLRRWQGQEIYRRIQEARDGGEPFVLHDGPPYANGAIHVGHLLNRVLKDLVVRSRLMMGYSSPFVPGWDCHGLPIEHRVMTDLIAAGKADKINALDDDTRRMAIRRECARYAGKYQKMQAEQMERLLTLADYDDPYVTMTPVYEAAALEVFAGLIEQRLVYRDLKPVHWSIANETALAEAELEYRDREDPSVYVAFDAVDPAAAAGRFGAAPPDGGGPGGPVSFLIWTTTPWTLPANLAIAVHPELTYSLVSFAGAAGGERLLVIAKELVERVAATVGATGVETHAEIAGSELVGLTYEHPFIDREAPVVAADYVTLEDGTGLVHTAPGHGQEDFETGHREGLAIYCPVQDDGSYDDTVPEWLRGLTVWEANPQVVERLRGSGHLLHDEPYEHSYPHDWRSKTPTIFRCTEQWFVAVDKAMPRDGRSLRDAALSAADDEITFYPGWGAKRLRGMLESRPDWCISRQRSWGLPIPAFRRPDGSVLLTAATVRAVAARFAEAGADAWFTEEPAKLLAAYDPDSDAELADGDSFEVAELAKMYDIFDVWFESGSSWRAVLVERGLRYPCDLYLEGSDQHRGWFQLSILNALGVTGRSPFTGLLTHGFMVDKDGRKMSKSLGNALEVDELLADFGADVCRWWVSSLAFENDIKVDLDYFQLAGESYRKVRNTLRFLLSNLADFDPASDSGEEPPPRSVDAYILNAAAALREKVLTAYRRYEFRQAHLALFNFCNDTLSAFYLSAVKDRLYCDRPDSPRRRATQRAMYRVTELLTVLLAPILPHTAEEAYAELTGGDLSAGTGASVHLAPPPAAPAAPADAGWSAVLAAREAALKALEESKATGIENPLDAGLVLPDPDGALAPFRGELPDLLGVSRVTLSTTAEAVEVVDLRDEPRCERSWRRDETVELREDGGYLSDRDAEAVGVGNHESEKEV